jgi:hypothetical protein
MDIRLLSPTSFLYFAGKAYVSNGFSKLWNAISSIFGSKAKETNKEADPLTNKNVTTNPASYIQMRNYFLSVFSKEKGLDQSQSLGLESPEKIVVTEEEEEDMPQQTSEIVITTTPPTSPTSVNRGTITSTGQVIVTFMSMSS